MSLKANGAAVPEHIDPDEAIELIGRRTEKWFGYGTAEFIRRYEAGELNPDDRRVGDVVFLLDLAR